MTDWKEMLRKRDMERHRELRRRGEGSKKEIDVEAEMNRRHKPGDLSSRDLIASFRIGLKMPLYGPPPAEYQDAVGAWLSQRPRVTRLQLNRLGVWPGRADEQLCMGVPLLCQSDPTARWGWRLVSLQDGWDDPDQPGERQMVRDVRFPHVSADETGVLSDAAAAIFGDAAGAADTTADETTPPDQQHEA